MKTSQTFLRGMCLVVSAVGLMSLIACQAKVDGGNMPALPPPDMGQSLKLEGLWRTDCVSVPGTNVYTIQSIQFNGSSMSTVADVYTSSSCTQRYPGTSTSTSSGTYVMAGASTIPNADNIIYSLTDQDGQSENFYDVVLIEGNNLYLGVTKGASPSTRPTAVDRSLAFRER